MVRKHFNYQQGFSTVEILIALAIMVVIFSGVTLLIMGSQKLSEDTEVTHEAQLLAQKYIEEGRSAALTNFNSDQAITNQTITSPGTTFNYTLNRTQRYISPCMKEIAVKVSWTIERKNLYTNLTAQIANPAEALALGGACAASLPPGGGGAWTSCGSDLYVDIQPQGNAGNDISIFRSGGVKYMALASQHSNDATDDFWLYSVTNTAFNGIKSLNIVGSNGLAGVTVFKASDGINYAYVISADNQTQVHVISLADINNPIEVLTAKLNLPGNAAGTDIDYYNGFVYASAGNAIFKLNVSNPVLPTIAATVNAINGNGAVNKIFVVGGNIFAATSQSNKQLVIFNATSMAVTGSFGVSGNQQGTAVYSTGNVAYLGLEQAQNKPDFFLLNIASGGNPTLIKSKDLNHTSQSKLVDMVVWGNLAFLGSTKEEFEVWNIADVNNIYRQCTPGTVAQQAASLDLFDNVIYGAIRSNRAIRRYIDQNNPPQ